MWYWDPVKKTDGLGPGAFSWFHFMWLGIAAVCIFCMLYFFARKHDRKLEVLMTRIFAIIFLVTEILYQSFAAWYRGGFFMRYLPFNICSLPIFFTIASAFMKEGKAKNIVDNLNLSFCIAGGVGMLLFPTGPLKTPYVLRSIHTMFVHTTLASYGLYYYFSKEKYKKLNLTFIYPFMITLAGLMAFSTLINETVYYGCLYNVDPKVDFINFLLISRHYETSYPVIDPLRTSCFPVFLLVFFVAYTAIILGLHSATHGIYTLILKRKNKTNDIDNKKVTENKIINQENKTEEIKAESKEENK